MMMIFKQDIIKNCSELGNEYSYFSTLNDVVSCRKITTDIQTVSCDPGFSVTSVTEKGEGICTANESFTSHVNEFKSRKDFIRQCQNPQKNLFVVGELISLNQGWSQGALESVENVIKTIIS